MFFIFGWGHQKTKSFGPAVNHLCNNCRNETYWNLAQVSTWFTLFFIPIFPYSRKYLLMCPVCSYGYELDPPQFEKLKSLAETNKAIVQGKENLDKQLAGAKSSSAKSLDVVDSSRQDPAAAGKEVLFCRSCGNRIPQGSIFCNKCGARI